MLSAPLGIGTTVAVRTLWGLFGLATLLVFIGWTLSRGSVPLAVSWLSSTLPRWVSFQSRITGRDSSFS